jgi:trehalose/maltose hydrolase-like predicted phosphorylase
MTDGPAAWPLSSHSGDRWLEALLFHRTPAAHGGQEPIAGVEAPTGLDAVANLDARLAPLGEALDAAGIALRVVGSADAGTQPDAAGDLHAQVADTLAALAAEGIGPRLVGAIGRLPGLPEQVARHPGGLEALEALARTQLQLRRQRRVPQVVHDPAWTIRLSGIDPMRMRVEESLCTLADTRFGTRGTLEEDGAGTDPLVVADGRYMAGRGSGADATPTLLPGPLWTGLDASAEPPASAPRVLDLSSGLLFREPGSNPLRSVRFTSLARPGRAALRAEAPVGTLGAAGDLGLPDEAPRRSAARLNGTTVAVTAAESGWIAAASRSDTDTHDMRTVIERHVALASGDGDGPDTETQARLASRLDEPGFEALLREQRAAWARRWERAAVSIDGDPDTELAVRFALFHLMATVADQGEAAVGARGLSGRAYRGHVFWDADVFVLPFLAATHPPAARAMIAYRHRRLPAARKAAAAGGNDGARFPWESADDGTDVTPESAIGIDGREVEILTGRYQEHITADVAWAAAHTFDWTGYDDLATGPGRDLLLETARYWPSRATYDADGAAHILEVIGPDEYHGPIDDNAYTNAMARWNLRRAADTASADPAGTAPGEPDAWRALADALVTGFDPVTGRHEQFSGFDRLEEIMIAEAAAVPVAADVLLGREWTAQAQVIKQADVLMLHHLLPDDVPSGSLDADLDYYLPRTAHGSSLSPGIHASLLARAGRFDDALRLLRIAARIDLDDLTDTAAGGLHLAAMGSVWQAITYGFAGIRPVGAGPAGARLRIDPRLPDTWREIEVRVTFHGTPLRVCAGHERLRITAAGDAEVEVGGHPHRIGAGETTFTRAHDRWTRKADP